jgi:hypothetical protein
MIEWLEVFIVILLKIQNVQLQLLSNQHGDTSPIIFFIFMYQRHNCPTKAGWLSTEISISEHSITSRSRYWYWYWFDILGPFLKYYKYNVFSIHFAKPLHNYKTTIEHELLFQCSVPHCFVSVDWQLRNRHSTEIFQFRISGLLCVLFFLCCNSQTKV